MPAHDDEASAVMLYSESILTVQGRGKMKRLDRVAYRILRGDGDGRGVVRVPFDGTSPITSMRGWSIPTAGKPYEVRERDAIETGFTDIAGAELVTDTRVKLLRIPATAPGSIVGYEVEQELRPYVLADDWDFQDTLPVGQSRYSLRLAPGWTYKAFWINHEEVAPTTAAQGELTWTVSQVKPIALESRMPPWKGVAAKMVLALIPPDGQQGGFQSWRDMGTWYLDLTRNRRDPSPEISQKVKDLTATAPDVLAKMQALASYVQNDIRYVAIELGIGGLQPHAASEVFSHRYGDCKDKATLLSSMLKEIGVDSYYVPINSERGSLSASTPPHNGFNHVILAIRLPAGLDAASLRATVANPKLGRLLFFDPTETLVPLGALSGDLQANYGLLITPDGGELTQLPLLPADSNGVRRTAKLTLDESGTLRGEVIEAWTGDAAVAQRHRLENVVNEAEQLKPVESMLSHSLGAFAIEKATLGGRKLLDRPLEWRYTLEAKQYSRTAGDLILLRPRAVGSLTSALLETKEARRHPIEFNARELDTDVFDITLPAGFVVDDLPAAVNEDLGFAAYRSSTQIVDKRTLRYTRSFEIREVSVPAEKAPDLKRLYRVIEGDERATAVFKRNATP